MKKKKWLAEKNKMLQDNMNCKNLTLLTIDVMYTYILEWESEREYSMCDILISSFYLYIFCNFL